MKWYRTGNENTTLREQHGLRNTPEYRLWSNIKTRCYNPSGQDYKWYGERGIKMDEKWKKSFSAFLKDIGHRPTPKHTFDRIDSNGNYEPRNTRWATWKEQQNNRRDNHLITLNGKTQTLAKWSEDTGIGEATLRYRLKHWTVEESLEL